MMSGVFISMRLSHPFADAGRLCRNLGFEPKREWLAGQPKQTPKGMVLEGVYSSSYCACELPLDQATDLEEGLQLAIEVLKPRTDVLNRFTQDGGRISIFVSLEKGVFGGAQLTPHILAQLAALHVFLEIDRNF